MVGVQILVKKKECCENIFYTTKPHDYDSNFLNSESHDSKCYDPDTLASMNTPNYVKIEIALVNTVAYQHTCQLPRSQSFSITLSNGETSARSASASAEKWIDLTDFTI